MRKRMTGIKKWIRFGRAEGIPPYRKLVEVMPCEIQGVTLMVHKNMEPLRKRKSYVWRVSDPFTGAMVSIQDYTTRKEAIKYTTERVIAMEEIKGKSFPEILGELQAQYGDVLLLPEEGREDATKESMPA